MKIGNTWKHKIVPVATLRDFAETEETLSLLREGGLLVIEITYRTAYAREAVKYAAKHYPDIFVGAGTIVNEEQCLNAIEAGAKFIVGPGFSAGVAAVCEEKGVPYLPGTVTPTEIMAAIDCGLDAVKFFPYSCFGELAGVNALSAPFPSVKFMLTNGITEENCAELLRHKRVIGVGGSWMLKGTREEKLAKIKKAAQVCI